jgi:hypothetical protein
MNIVLQINLILFYLFFYLHLQKKKTQGTKKKK